MTKRLEISSLYRQLGYPDLAAGEAYKALLLIDEVGEEGEFHEEALEAANVDYLSARLDNLELREAAEDSQDVVKWIQTTCLREAYVNNFVVRSSEFVTDACRYTIIIECLMECGSLRSSFEFMNRARSAIPDHEQFKNYDASLRETVQAYFRSRGENPDNIDVDGYPDKGFVRRENYPWNHHEPDRTSTECLNLLNEEMGQIAPKLVVKVSELPLLSNSDSTHGLDAPKYVKQLGVFARQDISPGTEILIEKSLLTGISRLHDAYCDACSIAFPGTQTDNADNTIVACEECDEVFFCSTECHDLAQDLYHPAICGVNIDQGKVSASDAADHLYTLLLLRALALAETQDVHPLDLKEVRFIWGDYHTEDIEAAWTSRTSTTDSFSGLPRTLPFSFKSNILTPLQILEKMDVNIFTKSNCYDTWVFNTLYAKFRGTASAQQGPDGRPEIGAVHPLWCLANHSCDPNVRWEWRGCMRFWTRETLVNWPGRPQEKAPGIKKGEEVFGHYCDIRLPVKERREWALGALGGECMCPRCVWEAAHV